MRISYTSALYLLATVSIMGFAISPAFSETPATEPAAVTATPVAAPATAPVTEPAAAVPTPAPTPETTPAVTPVVAPAVAPTEAAPVATLVVATPAPAVTPVTTPEATPAVVPKVYVRRTYEHQQVVDQKDHVYTPNLGRAGEIAVSDNDRVVIGKYLNHHYKNTCAWEHDLRVKTCVAPAPATKRNYMIGYALPNHVTVEEIPAPVVKYLRDVPSGYKYIRVENDVVLINASSREVIDAVTLASVYGAK